ncbi:MAG: hypothetical protein ACJAVK_000867 [Akkermansiaceae bacterium]|jgi:hypothetical protein
MSPLVSCLYLALLSLPGLADQFAAPEFHKPFTNPTDDPELPRVLIMGDSISIAYTTTVRRALKGKANVHRVKGNCADSGRGVENVKEWLGDGNWDVIHFNFGLWDWYGWKQERGTTPERFAGHLEKIVKVLSTTDAKLIFATTTPPCDEAESKIKVVITEQEAQTFRDAALAVMEENGVLINDLYSAISPDRRKYTLGKKDVHWNAAGNQLLGKRVARQIAHVLEHPGDLYPPAEKRKPSPGKTIYHIDPIKGNDDHSGLKPGLAWRTFARANQLLLAPGDRIEVIAPGAFAQTLALTGAGTAAAPIEVCFAPGRYDFHPDHAFRSIYHISNTNDDAEGRKAVGILLAGAKHVRLSGPDATIFFRGKMIEVCLDGCEDITISGLSFDYHRPTVSELQVEKIEGEYVDLKIHQDSAYKIEDGKIIWLGEGWHETGGLGQDLDPSNHRVRRVVDPLKNLSFEEIAPFHVRGRGKHRLKLEHIYQIRNPFRDCAGVFTRRSKNITWQDVHFRFLHGMGLVNQFSENLTFDTVTIAPGRKSGRTTAAWADGIQVSGCRGKLLVKDCLFSGAHDDAINIHGTYLRVVERLSDHQIKVRFMHKQTFGFMAFNPGDEVGFMHSDSMAGFQKNRVTQSRLISPVDMILTLEKAAPKTIRKTDVLENLTWNPEVEIRGCKVRRIPTRGFLVTSRGKVVIENNEFLATQMSGILIDADARGWFESGGVRDLTIRKNSFLDCGEPVVSINPQNTVPHNAVHQNIRIEENKFVLRGKTAVQAKSAKGLRVAGNRIWADEKLDAARSVKTADCADVVITGNVFGPFAE